MAVYRHTGHPRSSLHIARVVQEETETEARVAVISYLFNYIVILS